MKFITGVNYWPRNKGLAMWRDFDIQEITSDMETIAGLGMNSVRVFLRWSDFQPAPNQIDEAMMDRFEQVLDAARKAGIGV
ncbi:MAG: cellulase family glycosylhydrolase, partial [Bacillota bacterium]